MRSTCRDCGTPDYTPSNRSDVCVDCMDARLEIVRGLENGQVTNSDFRDIQRAMCNGRGTAARKVAKVLGK